MITVVTKGDFGNTETFLGKLKRIRYEDLLSSIGEKGVIALATATPVDTGKTAASWGYELKISESQATLSWINTNIVRYVNIAMILQYGHATGTGGYVPGRDYINPAMEPIYELVSKKIGEVIKQ